METTVKTVWYRNTATGVAWEVEAGSPLEKRLKRELTEDDNPDLLYERLRTAPKTHEEAVGQ